MKRALRLLLLVLLFMGSVSDQTVTRCEIREDGVRRELMAAFDAVSEAEEAGGDVSGLVEGLSEALKLLSSGGEQDLMLAESIVESVLEEAPVVAELGAASARMERIWLGLILSLVVVSAIAIWRFGPRVFWSLWLRSKRDWGVRR
ncbi:MAG: hypothetical protein NWE79_01935 [Candidatus Bathyarchaeota archaeon]|nr:hypothetical protein [Candidatus Bathyarchaeota archaeon]